MLKFPEKSIDLKVDDRSYPIKFPKTGQLMEIQALKSKLLLGQQGAILDAETQDGNYVSVLADMQAHFTVICPKLIEDLNVKTISELDAIDSARLVKVFIEQYLPWYREWRMILQNGGEPVKEEEEGKELKKEEKPTSNKNTPQIKAE